MRTLVIVVVMTAAMLSVGVTSSRATEGPWCAWSTIGEADYVENCSMSSYEMCRREITGGNRGSCYPNPRFHGGTAQSPRRQDERRR